MRTRALDGRAAEPSSSGGATRSWASIDRDLVTVVLHDTLSKGERRLVAAGQAQLVRRLRAAYQEAMRNELIAGVEEVTGRRVIAFLSAHHLDPDIAVESFVLQASRSDRGATPAGAS